nr:MAG TPA: hypothetical protein [Crassvirales sp.]
MIAQMHSQIWDIRGVSLSILGDQKVFTNFVTLQHKNHFKHYRKGLAGRLGPYII